MTSEHIRAFVEVIAVTWQADQLERSRTPEDAKLELRGVQHDFRRSYLLLTISWHVYLRTIVEKTSLLVLVIADVVSCVDSILCLLSQT